jgi:hypothetical protein
MNPTIRDIIFATVIGDALGYTLEGMSRGHIQARFGKIDGFADPAAALKGKLHRWRKSGLYSSITQFMIILGIHALGRGTFLDSFVRSVHDAPSLPGAPEGIFRGAGELERRFINAHRERSAGHAPPTHAGARIIPSLAPLAFREPAAAHLTKDVLGYLRLFTADPGTLAAGLVYASLLRLPGTHGPRGNDAAGEAAETALRLAGAVGESPAAVFEAGINPDALNNALMDLRETFSALGAATDIDDAEGIIIRMTSPRLKTPITRATVDIPGALLPLAVAITSRFSGPDTLFHAVSRGGATAALGAMTGALSTAWRGAGTVPASLSGSLVNKKRILSLAEAFEARRVPPSLAGEFILAEASLTAKENDERAARCRHGGKQAPRPKASGPVREAALSRHIVESWTKLDRSRWKREQRDRKRTQGDEES